MNKGTVTWPKICLVSHFAGGTQGGQSTTQAELLANHLRRDGHEVICISKRTTRIGRLADILYVILRHRHQIDVLLIEVYSGLSFIIADLTGWLAKLLHIPSVFVLHGGNLPEHVMRYPRWSMRVIARARLVTAPSEFLASLMRKKGVPVRLIPNVLSQFPDESVQDRTLQPKLLWMRSFHAIYDPLTAVRVFSLVRKRYQNASLVMAGSDKGLEDLTKQYVAELGLSDSVAFPGFLDAEGKAREFLDADIYLNTNIVDNSPVAVIEAWSYGLPVVTTNVGGIPFMVSHGINGLLARHGDVEGMAANIETILESPELAGSLSRNGRESARKSTWKSVRPLWERVFDEMSSEPAASRINHPA